MSLPAVAVIAALGVLCTCSGGVSLSVLRANEPPEGKTPAVGGISGVRGFQPGDVAHQFAQPTCRHRDTFAIVGWAEKNGKFDGIYLGRNDEGEFAYGGKVERGFSEEDKKNLLARLRPLRIKRPPIAAPRSFPKARWVQPRVLVDVEFRGKTGEGLLRHSAYQSIREDLMANTNRRSGRRPAPQSEPR